MDHDWERMKKTNCDQVVDNVDAMNEIFKHLDAHSLAVASCVSKRWHMAAMDDNLWEVICTRHWPASGICIGRLKSVVNVLGGFRRLYAKWLHPLCTRHKSAASNSNNNNNKDLDNNVVWTADQVQLSLSLLSVEYFEKLGPFATASCHGNISTPRSLHKIVVWDSAAYQTVGLICLYFYFSSNGTNSGRRQQKRNLAIGHEC